MLLSHRHKFIFLHIFKTGSTSVTRMLLPYVRWRDRAAFGRGRVKRGLVRFNRMFGLEHNGMRHITGYHKFATANEVRNKLGARRFDQYYSFTFVRNPYDRWVSLYFHLRRLHRHPLHDVVRRMSFSEYIEWVLVRQPDRLIDVLQDEQGRPLLDFVGRLEEFDTDLKQVELALGLPLGAVLHENATPGRRRDYRGYYDDRSREAVQRYFEDDLLRLGYDFDGLTGPMSFSRSRPQRQTADEPISVPVASTALGRVDGYELR